MDYIIVKKGQIYQEYPIVKNIVLGMIRYGLAGQTLVRKNGEETLFVSPMVWYEDKINGDFLFLQGETFAYERKPVITIGNCDSDIEIKDMPYHIIITDKEMERSPNQEEEIVNYPVFLNRMVVQKSKSSIREGDVLLLGTCKIVVLSEKLILTAGSGTIESKLLEVSARKEVFENFPHYKRSPRLIKRPNQSTIEILKVPAKITMKRAGLIQIIVTPLAMMAVTVGMSILMKRGLYVWMSVAGTVMTLIFSGVKFLRDSKECKTKEAHRIKTYEAYLLKKRKEIYHAYQTEKESYEYNYPSVREIEKMVENYSSRIYERSNMDDDFLTISIGLEQASTGFSIKINYDEMAMEKDELDQDVYHLKNEFSFMHKKAVVIDLKQSHLGLVGERENVHEQLKLIVSQLTCFQSYHDLEMIAIYDSKYDKDFKWMRWYPHLRIKAVNAFGIINSERMRDQILGSIHQIIRDRKIKLEESKKEGRFLPHYVFMIDEPKLVMDHSIMEYLGKAGVELGFSVIYTSHLRTNLPENMDTVVVLENSDSGRLLLWNKHMINKPFLLSHIQDINLERMARNLGVLIHEQGVVSQIPESITFFDMYKVEHPGELNVRERWKNNESHKTLAVPLGVRASDDYVYLNLHEKAHGPHGLVAGTTGSGKSEMVQSYIISLAVNFHPYEVGFLLIDYKGGGMAGLFKDLPHLLGMITNLDGSESMRAMASIKSELSRRQRIFSQNEVNHINAYNKLFKMGKVEEPIPHLFLISDEFAELKKEQPEFMSELVSAARIGRSLGIHLILATQKPSGVVDDQIWTNSKFKLALKVQNEADSKEMLKTPDAANITQAGRAYLQVGNNEIYELFQSAWSGAAYMGEAEEESTDNRVYLVNELGQGDLINQDLSDDMEKEKIRATQLDVVVEHLKHVFDEEQLEPVKRPWLTPLPKLLVSPHMDIERICGRDYSQSVDLEIAIGLVDIPEKQMQQEYTLNLIEDGNLAIFGASGFGKTMALSTIMLTMAIKNSPKLLKYYIVDFGNSGLILLKHLPHTADYLNLDDEEKLGKLVKIFMGEVQMRKRLFARESAMNFDMYNRVAEEKLPAIVWFIDNYDIVKEMAQELEECVAQISRDGMGLGIYLIIAASKSGALKYTITNNFKNKVALYMLDKNDINAVVGRPPYPLGEIKGRGFIKLEAVNQMQFYSAVEFEDVLDYTEKIRILTEGISSAFYTEKNEGIPVIPDTLDMQNFKDYMEEQQDMYKIPVGLNTESVTTAYIDLHNNKQMIVGGPQTGKTNMLKVIIENISPEVRTYIIDDKGNELYAYQSMEHVSYHAQTEDIAEFISDLGSLVSERKAAFAAEREEDSSLLPKQFYSQQPPVLVLIEDFDHFLELLKGARISEAEKLILELASIHITIIATVPANKLRGIDVLTKYIKDTIHGMILGSPSEQGIYSIGYTRRMKAEITKGHIFRKGEIIKIQIPKI